MMNEKDLKEYHDLDKLKQYMGGGSQNVVVTGKIVGNDIWLSNEKTQFNRQRTT